MMSGQTSRHEYLESQLADFVGKPDAFLLNFGYQGMISIIDSLTSRFDCIVYDAESHACIMDGLRLSPAKRYVYVHNDMSSLRKQLEHATKYVATTGGGILVVTEGVFGMAGDLGKLDEITALKSEFNFRLLVPVQVNISVFRIKWTFISVLLPKLWQVSALSSPQMKMYVCLCVIPCVHKCSQNP